MAATNTSTGIRPVRNNEPELNMVDPLSRVLSPCSRKRNTANGAAIPLQRSSPSSARPPHAQSGAWLASWVEATTDVREREPPGSFGGSAPTPQCDNCGARGVGHEEQAGVQG